MRHLLLDYTLLLLIKCINASAIEYLV